MKLQWITKRWLPGITTYSWHNPVSGVHVLIEGGQQTIPAPFKSSHAAAAAWAADRIGQSMTLLARGHS